MPLSIGPQDGDAEAVPSTKAMEVWAKRGKAELLEVLSQVRSSAACLCSMSAASGAPWAVASRPVHTFAACAGTCVCVRASASAGVLLFLTSILLIALSACVLHLRPSDLAHRGCAGSWELRGCTDKGAAPTHSSPAYYADASACWEWVRMAVLLLDHADCIRRDERSCRRAHMRGADGRAWNTPAGCVCVCVCVCAVTHLQCFTRAWSCSHIPQLLLTLSKTPHAIPKLHSSVPAAFLGCTPPAFFSCRSPMRHTGTAAGAPCLPVCVISKRSVMCACTCWRLALCAFSACNAHSAQQQRVPCLPVLLLHTLLRRSSKCLGQRRKMTGSTAARKEAGALAPTTGAGAWQTVEGRARSTR